MQSHTIRVVHKFLGWAPPSIGASYGAILGIAATAASVNTDAKLFLDGQISWWRYVVTNGWFFPFTALVIALWLFAFIWSMEREPAPDRGPLKSRRRIDQALGRIRGIFPKNTASPAKSHHPDEAPRDTQLSEALAYAELREWGRSFFDATATNGSMANEILKRFRQLAHDGSLSVWGKRSEDGVFQRIPVEHWLDHNVEWFDLLRGAARTENVTNTLSRPFYEIMVSKAEFEREWPLADQAQSATPQVTSEQATPVPSSKADILARRIREHPATAQFDYPTLKAILRLEILHPTGQKSAQAGSPPFKTEVTAKVSSIHKTALAGCSVFLISVERHGIAETINRPFSSGGEGTFNASPHMPHTFYLVTRNLGDPITPDPFSMKLVGQTVTLEECTDYKLVLELRAPPYPFPTIAEVTIRTGIGLDLECTITGQHLPEIKDDD